MDDAPHAPREDLLFQIGDIVGEHYEVLSLLGAGGMGQVFEARDTLLQRRVALKVARPGLAMATLRQEARALAAFRHPSLVTVHTMGKHHGAEFLVMERIYGVNLAHHMETREMSGQPIGTLEAIQIMIAIAEGLAIVHRAGLAHRDVKPENIMMTPDHRVVLMDFGLVLPEFHLAQQERICGSPPYMAPEALSNTMQPGGGRLLDLYSLGVIGFELLTTELPVEARSVTELFDKHQNEETRRLDTIRSDTPTTLVALIHELLAKAPANRPQSAESVAWRLKSLEDDLVTRSHAPTIAPPPMKERRRSVLIVDDNADIVKVLSFYVRSLLGNEIDVEVASNGEAAMTAIRRSEPDLMLLDLHMPRMNGIEVCMAIRGENLCERTKIISVSAGAQDDDKQLLFQLGIHHFVEKGSNLKTRLGAAIEDAMGTAVAT